jgi:outer membrane protein OmpA-like peptidoglycan-associated protein
MSRIAAHGRKVAASRPESRRYGPIPAVAGALALALGLAPVLAPQATAQSRSGIFINNDVLNNLGPGPEAAPPAPMPMAPAAPLSPGGQPGYQAPDYPPAAGGSGGLSFQPQGSGNFVVTRPGTLLFPPLQDPQSTLTPGFGGVDNQAARARALDNAFAEGPEPRSQLLIPPQSDTGNDSVMVFMDQLPTADPDADRSAAPVLVLQAPPQPAPRKPAVPTQALAEFQLPPAADGPAELAPEFRAPEPPAMAELPPEPTVEQSDIAAEAAAVEAAAVDETPAPILAEASTSAPMSGAPTGSAPMNSAEVAAPVAMAEEPAGDAAPVSLLPSDTRATVAADTAETPVPAAPAGLQTASLTVDGGIADMTFLFDVDSAELSADVESELRSLADALLTNEDWIQVLGFASGQDSSGDQARKLALSRALKVRSFLIDAGIPSTRIQVRSLGDRAEDGPANRVDIKPIGS